MHIPSTHSCRGVKLRLLRAQNSAEFGREVHFGYFVGRRTRGKCLAEQTQIRQERIRSICTQLAKINVMIDAEEILQSVDGNAGRPHVARAMIKKRYVKNFNEAFQKYLGRGCPAYVETKRLHAEAAIDLIHAAGALQ